MAKTAAKTATKIKDNNAKSSKAKKKKPKFFISNGNCDYQIVFLTVALVLFGLMMVYSSSSYKAILAGNEAGYLAERQAIFAAAGFVLMILASRVNYRWYQHFAKVLMLISIALGLYVLIAGATSGGAVRWIQLGSIKFQPSEMAKPIIIMYVADMCSEHPSKLKSIKGMIEIAFLPLVNCGLILIENLSTALICIVIIISMIIVASPNWKIFFKPLYILIYVVAIAGLLIAAFAGEKNAYRRVRIQAWLHPEKYPDDTYQTLQSLYAIGSGGLFGRGLGQSIQKTGNLPEAHNDMIFAIICEELGLFGGLVLLAAFVMLIFRLLYVMKNTPDSFGGLVLVGIMVHISVQLLVNIGVVTNTIPNTGVTLPFVSYGGTSLLFLLIEIGMALSVSRQQRFE
jgi:cell division protein FtsW